MDVLAERLSNPLVFVPLVLVVASVIYSHLTAEEEIPHTLPWIGKESNKLFAETRAHFASFTKVRQWLTEGYEKYSKQGKTYVFPDFTGKPEIIIPPSQIPWLLEQPDTVLSVNELHHDILAGDYNFTSPKIIKEPYHEHVVFRNLPRRIGVLVPDIWEELGDSIDQQWGTDTENWKDVCVFETMMQIIARVSNRVLVGMPLCRNEGYLKAMAGFSSDVMTTVFFLRFTPKLLQPLLGPIFALPNTIHYRQTRQYTLPLVKERIENMKKKDADPSFEWEEPNDFLMWHIRCAYRENNVQEMDPEMACRRLMPLGFAAIHTTTFTITNCVLDLAASPTYADCVKADPNAANPLESIRQEALETYLSSGKTWSKANLANMLKADSAIRESMRVRNFLSRGLMRKVISKGGLENKHEGWKLPHGAFVGVAVHSIMHDPEIYSNADDFDPFRFSRIREEQSKIEAELAANGSTEKKMANGSAISNGHAPEEKPTNSNNGRSQKLLQHKQLGLSTTSESFLPFGHGRKAWYRARNISSMYFSLLISHSPGRFLVSHELKMLLAYITMHYEIEPLQERPPNTWIGQSVLPPMKATIRVRRRKAAETGL
jgi:cytochrome P450